MAVSFGHWHLWALKENKTWFWDFLLQAPPPPKAVKKATPAKKAPVVKNGVGAKKAESEDDDEDDDEEESGKWLSPFVQQQIFWPCCNSQFDH